MEADVRQEFDEIKAILKAVAKSQAAADARMDRLDARMDRADARMDRSDERFEKRMRGFEKLVRIGVDRTSQVRKRDGQKNRRAGKCPAAHRSQSQSLPRLPSQRRERAPARAESLTPNTWHLTPNPCLL